MSKRAGKQLKSILTLAFMFLLATVSGAAQESGGLVRGYSNPEPLVQRAGAIDSTTSSTRKLSNSESASSEHAPTFPLADGEYEFALRFAEHPSIPGPKLRVVILGDSVFVEEFGQTSELSSRFRIAGILLWHGNSKQWIIGESEADSDAPEVGGCSDGPYVIDPETFELWTC